MAIIYGDVVGTTQRPANWNETSPSEVEHIGGNKPTIHKEADGNHTDHNIILDGKIVKGSGRPTDGTDLVPKDYVDDRYSIFAFDQSIPTNAWEDYYSSGTAETNLYAEGYVKRAKLSVGGVESSMVPYLTPDVHTIATSGTDLAPQGQCTSGGVYLYARSVPSGPVTILTIEFRRVVR